MKVLHRFTAESAVFDDDNLVSHAGLVPVMRLAHSTGLASLLAEQVDLGTTQVASAGANLDAKLLTVIAGFCCGADSIDDLNLVRAGGHTRLFEPSWIGWRPRLGHRHLGGGCLTVAPLVLNGRAVADR